MYERKREGGGREGRIKRKGGRKERWKRVQGRAEGRKEGREGEVGGRGGRSHWETLHVERPSTAVMSKASQVNLHFFIWREYERISQESSYLDG